MSMSAQGSAVDIGPHLRSVYVTTSRDDHLGDVINALLQRGDDGEPICKPCHFTATGETRGIMVVAKSGTGKTSMIDRALKRHEALQPTSADHRPVVAVRVPSPATTKALGVAILKAAGYMQVSSRAKEWEIWGAVRHRLAQLETAILWIDEAQDLFRTRGQIDTRNILNLIKAQMQGDGSVIVILSGVEELQSITQTDRQIARRFRKVQLPDVNAAGDGALLRQVIEGYCGKAGLESPDFRSELIARLVHGAHGRFGLCIEMIVDAIEIALDEGAPALEIGHFAEAYTMQTGCNAADNVYLSRNWSRIDPAQVLDSAGAA